MFNIISVILFAGAVGTAGYYLHQYDSRGKQIVVLENTVSRLENDVKVQKNNTAIANDTIKGLGERLASRLGELKDNCEMLAGIAADEAENAKPENKDKPVDTIGRLLERLKGKPTK